MKNCIKKSQEGYIALISLLIIAAVTLVISTSLTIVSISEAQASLSFTEGIEARYMAESCTEEALLRLRDNSAYTSGTLTIENDSCTINITGGNPYTITVTGSTSTVPTYTKKIQIIAKKAGRSINIISWQEIE